jgi:hypothetical protein
LKKVPIYYSNFSPKIKTTISSIRKHAKQHILAPSTQRHVLTATLGVQDGWHLVIDTIKHEKVTVTRQHILNGMGLV